MGVGSIRKQFSAAATQLRLDLIVIGSGLAARTALEEVGRRRLHPSSIAQITSGPASDNQQEAIGQFLTQAARAIHRRGVLSGRFSTGDGTKADSSSVVQCARRLRDLLATDDSSVRSAEGIMVLPGEARFLGRDRLEADGREIQFRRAILAPAAEPVEAAIPGAEATGFLTPSDLLEQSTLPDRLALLGDGPEACRWAQTVQRLGSQVHVFGSSPGLLPEEEPEAAEVVRRQLANEGIQMHLGCEQLSLDRTGSQRSVVFQRGGRKEKLFVDQVLLLPARRPNLCGLCLEAAGIATDGSRVVVGRQLHTSNRRVLAAGEICGRQFAAESVTRAMARRCVENATGWRRREFDPRLVSQGVWTDPQIVRVGLSQAEAAAAEVAIDSYRVQLAELAPFAVEGGPEGFVLAHVRRATGRVVGACVVAEEACDFIAPLVLLMVRRLPLSVLGDLMLCRPSRFEAMESLAERFGRGPQPSLWSLADETRRIWRRRMRDFLHRRLAQAGQNLLC
jgi:pyruvate/2-oxoglutarate dehydrogenase complex dihydrolipoamide dehydrogenase (E3) component